MRIANSVPELRELLADYHAPAFVPTMGNLHEGHISLITKTKDLGDVTVASIFVNRLEFLPHEDFDRYPRALLQDAGKLKAAGCDILFAPGEMDLYPEPQTFKVQPDPQLADILEGEFRPGFFTGVCTVVMRLFAAVQPRAAVFGKKDYQQLKVIQRMVQQFSLPIEIIGCETARAEDGLALSSRNGFLSREERAQAMQLPETLKRMAAGVCADAHLGKVEDAAMQFLRERGWTPDYMAVRSRFDLRLPRQNDPLIVLGAARIGNTRLIDNLEV